MAEAKWKRIVVLLLCIGFSAALTYQVRQRAHGTIVMTDLGELYYGARCAMQHIDPYDPSAVLREFTAAGGRFRSDSVGEEANRIGVTNCINLPTGLFLAIPFALLPWGLAQGLWVVLLAGLLVAAASLTWDLGGSASPAVWVCVAGFMLANCELALTGGNTASIAASACVIAAWCFLKDRFAPAGAVLLAVGLVLKPQDAGFVWLYFLMVGGVQRKRALQTLVVAGILGGCAAIWIAPSSPHWVQELHRNVGAELVHGGISDPGPSGLLSRNVGELIDLQTAVSVFRDDPIFYNPISYAMDGLLILAWAFAVLRRRFSAEDAPFALAAIAVLTLLPVYHRTYDAKLLLLTIPACALLWAGKGPRRWIVLLLTSAGILVTSDIPLAILLRLTRGLPDYPATVAGKMMNMVLLRPAPLVLLALGVFYLWVYLRRDAPALPRRESTEAMPTMTEST